MQFIPEMAKLNFQQPLLNSFKLPVTKTEVWRKFCYKYQNK